MIARLNSEGEDEDAVMVVMDLNGVEVIFEVTDITSGTVEGELILLTGTPVIDEPEKEDPVATS